MEHRSLLEQLLIGPTTVILGQLATQPGFPRVIYELCDLNNTYDDLQTTLFQLHLRSSVYEDYLDLILFIGALRGDPAILEYVLEYALTHSIYDSIRWIQDHLGSRLSLDFPHDYQETPHWRITRYYFRTNHERYSLNAYDKLTGCCVGHLLVSHVYPPSTPQTVNESLSALLTVQPGFYLELLETFLAGRAIGNDLLRCLVRLAEEENYDYIYLERAKNPRFLHAYYHQRGFQDIDGHKYYMVGRREDIRLALQ